MPTGDKGGYADKIGGEYEWLWTSGRVADILEGTFDSITIEPPGSDGEGVEFWLGRPDGTRSYEQVKLRSSGNWTMKSLIEAGVLKKVQPHLADGHAFRFVSTAQAQHLEVLSRLARGDGGPDELYEAAGQDLRAELDRLERAWDVTADTVQQYLTQIVVEQWGTRALRRTVGLRFEVLFDGHGEDARSRLREGTGQRLRERLGIGDLEAMLAASPAIRRGILAPDPARTALAARRLQLYIRRIEQRAPVTGLAERPEAGDVLQSLRDPDGRCLTVVHGGAGSGKSAVAAQVARQLSDDGWVVLPLSMDKVQSGDITPEAIATRFGLDRSPATLIAASARSGPSLLLIDQLDALSTFGGRMPDCFDAVEELVEALVATGGNARVLMVVRTVDMEQDERIAGLVRRAGTEYPVARLDSAAVSDALASAGIAGASVPPLTRELLRTPLHLALFLRLQAGSRESSIQSLTDLYRRFVEDERRRLEVAHPDLDWTGIIDDLATYMSGRAQLTAPRSVLRARPITHVEALASAGVLHVTADSVEFFHESFFDHVFAESFISGGTDLLPWLTAGPQVLYRRTQVRQILTQLAATDRNAFHRRLVDLMLHHDVRSHIKDAAAGALMAIPVQPGDWVAIDEVIRRAGGPGRRLVRLLRSPDWFDEADRDGHVARYLTDPDLAADVRWELHSLAGQRGRRVVDLFEPHVGDDDGWDEAILRLTWHPMGPEVARFLMDLIDIGHFDPADDDSTSGLHPRLWRALGDLDDDTTVPAELLGTVLRRADLLAQTRDDKDPFQGGLIPHGRGDEAAALATIARRDPEAFLDQTLPFIEAVASRGTIDHTGLTRPPAWRWLHEHDHFTFADTLFHAVRSTLRQQSATNKPAAHRIAARLGASPSYPMRVLAATVYLSTGEADPAPAITWLLADDANLEIGWDDSPRWLSRQVVAAACRTAPNGKVARLEQRLLSFYPEGRWGPDSRRRWGRSQLDLLSAIPVGRLSDRGWTRRLELERALSPTPTPGPLVRVGWVKPPIPQERHSHMRDDDWLRAIDKYQSDEDGPRWNVGGVSQMAQALRSAAGVEPDRFIALARAYRLPLAYLDTIVAAVKSTATGGDLADLCEDLAARPAQTGRAVCWAIEANRSNEHRLCDLISHFAIDPDPIPDAAPTDDEDLDSRAMNCVRGAAAEAAGALVQKHPRLLTDLSAALERLCDDPSPAVRLGAADAILALSNHDRPRAMDLAERILAPGVDLVASRRGRELLTWCCIWDPQRFEGHLLRALTAGGDAGSAGGFAWGVVVVRGEVTSGAPTDVTRLDVHARRGAAEAFAGAPDASLEQLCTLLTDVDESVRASAAAVSGELNQLAPHELERLALAFAAAPVMSDHGGGFARALTKLTTALPRSMVSVVNAAISELAKDRLAAVHGGGADVHDIIPLLLRLYREGDTEAVEACLDAFDRLADLAALGAVAIDAY